MHGPSIPHPDRYVLVMNHAVRSRSGLRRTSRHIAVAVLGLATMGSACAEGNDSGGSTSSSGAPPTESTTTSSFDIPSASSTSPMTLEQVALWPDPSVVFASPRAVVEDFVVQVLRVPPEIGDFMAGDSRSGEIVVNSPGDPPSQRGLLLLRQLGPRNGWFVIGTINDSAFITSPEFGQTVPSREILVRGVAEGFEATVIVEAFVAGRAEPILDRAVTYAGNLGVPAPFEVTLDLSAARAGDTVLIIVRGGVGLETDPGQFGAVAVVITSP